MAFGSRAKIQSLANGCSIAAGIRITNCDYFAREKGNMKNNIIMSQLQLLGKQADSKSICFIIIMNTLDSFYTKICRFTHQMRQKNCLEKAMFLTTAMLYACRLKSSSAAILPERDIKTDFTA